MCSGTISASASTEALPLRPPLADVLKVSRLADGRRAYNNYIMTEEVLGTGRHGTVTLGQDGKSGDWVVRGVSPLPMLHTYPPPLRP